MLDDLAQAREELPPREGPEEALVGDDDGGLVEGPDQVLAPGVVDGRLPSDAAVHLGEEGRGDLDQADAPHVDGCDEAGEVSDGPPAERDDRRPAVEPGLEEVSD